MRNSISAPTVGRSPWLKTLGLLILASLLAASSASALSRLPFVRSLETDDWFDVRGLEGLAFPPGAGTLLRLDDPREGELLVLRADGEPAVRLGLADGFQVAALPAAGGNVRLLVLDATGRELTLIRSSARGPHARTRFDLAALGLSAPRGIAVDATGGLWLLDAARGRVAVLRPGPGRDYDAARALAAGRVAWLDAPDLIGARGLARHPETAALYALDADGRLLELSPEGARRATWSLGELAGRTPRGLAIAPSGDRTDDADVMSLYLVASDERGAEVLEWSLEAPLLSALAVTDAAALPLLRVTETSSYSPPSPDPAGIAYLDFSDTLLMSDSEVNEMSIFEGVNVFELTRSGGLLDTFSTTDFSNEPTGVAYDPASGLLFFSDDNKDEIFVVDRGRDGVFGTNDDQVSSFDTRNFNSNDPEGLAFGQGTLFIVDGGSSEVYKLTPGGNGRFDGVPPEGDDQLSHFDTAGLGVTDPEGAAFDAGTGRLYVVGRPNDVVAELTPSGTLLRALDIGAANARKPAGLAVGPGSSDPGSTSLYVTDRGVDNNSDPRENDGKLYEFGLGEGGPGEPTNLPPTVDAGPDQTIALPAGASLDGGVADDDLPDPPAQVTTTWSAQSGPGPVSFDDPDALRTTARFTTMGRYVLRLTAFDGQLEAFDELEVEVTGPDGERALDLRVVASDDDAEQVARQRVSTNSSTLLMMGSGRKASEVVGIRFRDVSVPRNATILNAWVQFEASQGDQVGTTLQLRGHDVDHAPAFSRSKGDLSSRTPTSAAVSWSPPAWSAGSAGAAQRTPSLIPIVQEIVSRNGWASGNALVLLLTGNGQRVARSFDGSPAGAPRLYLEYRPN